MANALKTRSELIRQRFEMLDQMTVMALECKITSLIVSGAPGCGKSFGVQQRIDEMLDLYPDVPFVKLGGGNCTAAGLYEILYETRDGGIVLVDDCDDVFKDLTSINLLKVATDSTEERIITWKSQSSWLDKKDIPSSFEYNGTIIFLTNVNFLDKIEKNDAMSEHFKAFIDRSFYLDLFVHDRDDVIIRIEQIFDNINMDQNIKDDIISFIKANAERFYNLSFRTVKKLQALYDDGTDWQFQAENLLMKM